MKSTLAEHYRRIGEIDKSLQEWERLQKEYSQNPIVLINLAELYLATNNIKAIETLRDSIKPNNYTSTKIAHYCNGLLAYAQNKSAEALKYLGWASEIVNSREVFQYVWLASAAKENNLEAIIQGTTLIKKKKFSSRGLDEINVLLNESANRALRNNQPELARLISKEALSLNREFAAAHVTLLQESLMSGDNFRTIELANNMLNDPKTAVIALLSRGRAYLALKRIDLAKADFQQVIQAAPRYDLGYYWMGATYYKQNDFSQSVPFLQKAYAISPDIKTAQIYYGALKKSGYINQADQLINQMLQSKVAAHRSTAHRLLADKAMAANNQQQAIKEYQTILKLSPQDISAYLNLFELYLKDQNSIEAKKVVQSSLSNLSGNMYILFNAALWEEKFGDSQKAIMIYRSILDKNPNWTLVHCNLSDLYAKNKITAPEAMRLAETAVNYTPKWWAAQLVLGKRLWEQGDKSESVIHIKKALSLAPNNPDIMDYISKNKISPAALK